MSKKATLKKSKERGMTTISMPGDLIEEIDKLRVKLSSMVGVDISRSAVTRKVMEAGLKALKKK